MYQKARGMSTSHNLIVRKEIDHMLLDGTITPVESSRTSPAVIETKKDGSTRVCFEYRKLNSVMHADRCLCPELKKFSII